MEGRGTVRRVMVLATLVAASVAMAPTAATATSCAAHPLASPQAIAAGTERLAVEGPFRDHYDGAIFGTVRSMETQGDANHPEYGRTTVLVDVTGAYGPAVGDQAVLVQADPGWLSGYPFEAGTHYFVPYVQTPDGLHSMVCDPITEVDPAEVPDLVAAAQEAAWPRAPDDVPRAATPAPARDARPLWLGATTVVLGVLGSCAWVVRRRRLDHDQVTAG